MERARLLTETAVAHLPKDGREHSLSDHLPVFGQMASSFAATLNSAAFAEVAGLFHDLGNYAAAFQAYILSARSLQHRRDDPIEAHDETLEPRTRRVDHSTANLPHARGLNRPLVSLFAAFIAVPRAVHAECGSIPASSST